MILNSKNPGEAVPYQLEETRLTFGKRELSLDLAACQRDYPVHLDISRNASGKLVIGPSQRYVAEIDLPARSYLIVKGESDDLGFPRLSKIARPLEMEKVTLTLWALED